MEKGSFKFLKTLASMENCIDCVVDDVKRLSDDPQMDELRERVKHLVFWMDELIKDYHAE